MSEREFDLLDELYFITPYKQLKQSLGWDDRLLADLLQTLYRKGWIRCFEGPVREVPEGLADPGQNFARYHYLASKAGLMAHQHGEE